jgi:hypothetical protein
MCIGLQFSRTVIAIDGIVRIVHRKRALAPTLSPPIVCFARLCESVSFSPNLFISRCSKALPPPPSNRHSFPVVVYVYDGCQGSYGRKTVSRVYFFGPAAEGERAVENLQEMYIKCRICYTSFRGVACYADPPLDCALHRVHCTPM